MPRYNAKVDANQDELVKYLRALGYSVETRTSRMGEGFPDLLVGGMFQCPFCHVYYEQNLLIEVKTETGVLNKTQKEWHGNWRGQKDIAHNTQDLDRILRREWSATFRISSGCSTNGLITTEGGETREAPAQDDINGGAYRVSQEAWLRPDHDTGNAGTEGAA